MDEFELFTFHNVSINTGSWDEVEHMYTVFTFHNVSINTVYKVSEVLRYPDDLHSTMFLLILLQVRLYRCSSIFTFHNVSINTQLSIQ